jgi:predicted dithiol-disulfide oxidoreductase (DUF899 family)
MPMTKVTQDYTFHGAGGKSFSLADLFAGRKQLLIYHFMFDPSWTAGCSSCSFMGDEIPQHHEHLHALNTTFVMVSRAPIEQIEAFKKRMGWTMEWYSSEGSMFNYDFHVTQDESVREVEYNGASKEVLEGKGMKFFTRGEQPGLSVFYKEKEGGEVFHSYSCYSRGVDRLPMTTCLLDLTPLGRQDNPEKKGMTYRDEYTEEALKGTA